MTVISTRKGRSQRHWGFPALIMLALASSAHAEVYSRAISATPLTNPPRIKLDFTAHEFESSATIYRRLAGDPNRVRSEVATVGAGVTTWTDSNVSMGTLYEYAIQQGSDPHAIVSGIKVPLVEQRGKLILVVDETIVTPLASEIARLEEDLAGDGWTVIRRNYARHDDDNRTVLQEGLRQQIRQIYNADRNNVKGIFLLGKLPRVLSGDTNFDGHGDRPHATDLFYADLDQVWTDNTIANGETSEYKKNSPGDGRYDQIRIETGTEMFIGRVDLSTMPSWETDQGMDEIDLLRNYLRKNHEFRHGIMHVPVNGIYNFPRDTYGGPDQGDVRSLVGDAHALADDIKYHQAPGDGPFLFHSGTTYVENDSASRNYTGKPYSQCNLKAVFAQNFMSYRMEWQQPDNHMQQYLCMPEYGLTTTWGIWMYDFRYHMGMGAPIGFCKWFGINYEGESYYRYIHNNFMGDPTLRMHIIKPPRNVSASGSGSICDISWAVSQSNGLEGYHVYRATNRLGPFQRRTGTNPISGTSFRDTGVPSGTVYYMVRAVDLTVGNMGSYYNASQGIMVLKGGGGSSAPLNAPTNLQTNGITANSISLRWQDKSTNETGFQILCATDGGFTQNKKWKSVGADQTSATVTGLAANKRYYFQVRARNNNQSSDWSNPANAQTSDTPSSPVPPNAPTNLQANGITASSIALRWQDKSNNETAFQILCATDSSFTQNKKWKKVSANQTQYTVAGLVADKRYYFKVRALKENQDSNKNSSWSNTVNARTSSASGVAGDHAGLEDLSLFATARKGTAHTLWANSRSAAACVDNDDGTGVGTYTGSRHAYQWIGVDLGVTCAIEQVALLWRDDRHRAVNYVIEGAIQPDQWQTILIVTESAMVERSHIFSPRSVRYLRLRITEGGQAEMGNATTRVILNTLSVMGGALTGIQ